MANYEQGIATRIHYLRLSVEDTERVRLEAASLGIPMAELFRRMLDLYFEVKLAAPKSSPELTPRQAEDLMTKLDTNDDKKFDFTGEE